MTGCPDRPRLVQVLLVEDDLGDQRLVQRALAASEIPCVCRVAQDGEEALEYLRGTGRYHDRDAPRPDLILLDLNLPRIDGRSLLRSIRSDEKLKSLVVVVLTTSDRREDIDSAYEQGANCYLRKPDSAAGFTAVVQGLRDFWFRDVTLPVQEGFS